MRSIKLSRFNSILICAVLICIVLYYGRMVLIPLSFAVFFAMLMKPASDILEQWGIKRIYSTLISVIVVILISFVVITMIFIQFKNLANEMPKMKERSEILLNNAEHYLIQKVSISREQMDFGLNEINDYFLSSTTFFSSLTTFLRDVVLVFVFMFLFLYQREKYKLFFVKLIKEENEENAKIVIEKISKVAQYYFIGRCLSVIIFTLMFTAGFLIFGIKGSFLLAFIAALLTIVPYVGSIIGGLFPFAVALVTSDTATAAIGALSVVVIVQSFDNYFIEPYIIGGEVQISGFFTILILFIGGLLWGPAGMILFVPMLGVAKIVFDNVKELEPYGYLVGDQESTRQSTRMLKWFKKIVKKNPDE